VGFGGGAATPLVTPANPSTLLVNHELSTVSFGTCVYNDAVGGFARAKANVLGTSAAIGVVSDPSINAGELGGVQITGVVVGTTAQWDLVTGDSGGLQAVPYYVSATTGGMLTRTKPAIGVQVGVGLSTTEMLLTAGSTSTGGSGVTSIVAGANISISGPTGAVTISATSGVATVIDVTAAPYDADPTGVGDSTAGIQAALDAAAISKLPVWFPPGTYKVTQAGGADLSHSWCLLFAFDGLQIIGNNATIVWPSQTTICLRGDPGAKNFRMSGIGFQGANDDSYLTNNGFAVFLLGTVQDTTVRDCTFDHCVPFVFGSDGTDPGRFIFTNNRVTNNTGSVDTPYRSVITDNVFDNDTRPGLRSHFVYFSGATDGSVIANNVFRNSDTSAGCYAVQIRASASRYGNRQGFVITGNMFYHCAGGMWIGSDNDTVNSGYTVVGNTFKNCDISIFAYGMKDSTIGPNTILSTWEHTSLAAAIEVLSGAPVRASELSKSIGVNIIGNVISNLHPWFGIIDVTTLPTAGHTVTVGAKTYTWRAAASSTGEVTIGVSATTAAQNLGTALRGDAHNTPNLVLRDGQDAMFDPYPYDGSSTTRVVVASFATFAMSQSNSELTLTAAVNNNAYPAAGIIVTNTFGTKIANNILRDLTGGIQVAGSRDPTINDNQMYGSSIIGVSNAFSEYRGNRFMHTPYANGKDNRWLVITDGFYVEDDNGIGSTTSSQLRDVTGGGKSQIVPVGDGTARARLFYGTEYLQGSQPDANNSLPFRWTDGDEVRISNDTTISHRFFFKRTSPGAGEFNTADSLIALINATVDFTADYVPWVDTGSDVNPKLMIEVVHSPGGTAGNACYLAVLRVTTDGPDLRMLQTVGVLLLNAEASDGSQSFLTWFQGGSAAADKTVIWSPVASTVRGISATGVDSTSHALGPVGYVANIVPGVCAVLSHSAAAGTEKFFVRVH